MCPEKINLFKVICFLVRALVWRVEDIGRNLNGRFKSKIITNNYKRQNYNSLYDGIRSYLYHFGNGKDFSIRLKYNKPTNWKILNFYFIKLKFRSFKRYHNLIMKECKLKLHLLDWQKSEIYFSARWQG